MQYTHFHEGTSSAPSLALFEQSIRVRLEALALDADLPLECYQNADLDAVQENLEMQLLQLQFLLNEVHLLQTLKRLE